MTKTQGFKGVEGDKKKPLLSNGFFILEFLRETAGYVAMTFVT